MKFLDDLRAYLERPEPPRPVFVPDVAAHRRHLLEALDRAEKQGWNAAAVRREWGRWGDEALQRYVTSMARALATGLAHGSPRADVERLIDIALDRELDLGTSTGSHAKDIELDDLRRQAIYKDHGEPVASRYALELRAIRREGTGRALTPLGRLILELPDKEAIRWMLAAEVVQSRGSRDEWRISTDAAADLLAFPAGSIDTLTDEESEWPVPWVLLQRISQMGLVRLEDHYPKEPVLLYELLPEGRRLLEEIASGNDTPFMLLARALLQDETAAVLAQYPAAAGMVRKESAASLVTRHARMVAHEMRNVVVPIQIALEAFYQEVGERGAADLVERRRGVLDAGVDRIFRFVRDIAQIADLATTPAELFTLVPAIQNAVQAIGSEIPCRTSFVQEVDELPSIMGYRQRFIMAVGNLIRNAAQARQEPPVEIRVTAGVNNGAEVFVRVEDDGPGVPPEHREKVFAPGFSRRPGGSGQGLAYVREVVEEEMAGRVSCEESPLGGARFVIRLPVGTRRT